MNIVISRMVALPGAILSYVLTDVVNYIKKGFLKILKSSVRKGKCMRKRTVQNLFSIIFIAK